MKRELTCIVCPRGCRLTISDADGDLKVSGNSCKNGVAYGIQECREPLRTLTSVLRVSNRCDTMVSVKTSAPIRKQDMQDLMAILKSREVCAPIRIGTVLISGVFGVDIIATKTIY